MKSFAFVVDGEVREIVPETLEIDGTAYGLEDRYPAPDIERMVAMPAGKIGEVEPGWRCDGKKFQPPAPPEVTPGPPAETFKTSVWERCNDEQLPELSTRLEQAPERQRLMWRDCNSLLHNSELFQLLKEQMTEAFGAAETARILAPG